MPAESHAEDYYVPKIKSRLAAGVASRGNFEDQSDLRSDDPASIGEARQNHLKQRSQQRTKLSCAGQTSRPPPSTTGGAVGSGDRRIYRHQAAAKRFA